MCSPSAPVQEQKASTELPEWAKPYAKDILAKGQALTDVNQNPYQQYTQPRVAGFSPMQQQAMQNAQGMTVAPQTGEATAGATMAGLGGLGVAGQANPYGFQNQVGGYMNPYLQMSLAPQLAEANRAYDIGATKQQSAATQAGAFGGSREAIMAAENERNRNQGLNSIIGQGYNTAFNNAQNQYNQNNQTQLQGYGLMNTAASNLGQLGQNQYGQQMGINQLQNQYGTAQQNLAQTGLNNAYQDFQNQQNYPYKQLGFMSDMIRGLPLGQQSTSQIYQGAPTALQTVGALGMGAYGINQLTKADGGSVHDYAEGGVTSEGNIQAIIEKLSPQQLQQAKQHALARQDTPTVQAIDARLAELAADRSMTNGIAGAMPQQMADGIAHAAGGGILAFAGDENDNDPQTGQQVSTSYSPGNQQVYDASLGNALGAANRFATFRPSKADTPEQQDESLQASMARVNKLAGPSPYEGITAQLEQLKTESKEALQQGKGLAALSAMEGMLQPGGFLRGLGKAGKNFAESYAPAVKADQDMRKSSALMNINLASAQRNEKLGLVKDAQADYAQANKNRIEADKAARESYKQESDAFASIAKAAKPSRASNAGAGGAKPPKIAEQNYNNILADLQLTQKPKEGESSAAFNARIAREASKIAVAEAKTSDVGNTKADLEGNKLDVVSADKAADAWGNMSKASKASFAAANGFDVSRDPKTNKFVDPKWEEKSRQLHAKSFKPTGGASAPKVIKIPD
jgi:hypothetical protein